MKCAFFDFRADFGSILAEKLGSDFLIVSTSAAQPVRDCDVVLVAIPPSGHDLLEKQLSTLASAANNPAGIPVVALLAAPDHDRGSLKDLRVVRGVAGTEAAKALLETVATWRFHPALSRGKPVAVDALIGIRTGVH